jgi:hypothetical protein
LCCAEGCGNMTRGMPTRFWVTRHGRWRQALPLSSGVFWQIIKNLKNHKHIQRAEVSVSVTSLKTNIFIYTIMETSNFAM